MRYTIWRTDSDGNAFQITTAGATSIKERAFEKARVFNERLQTSEPATVDRYVVRDEEGKELKLPA